LRSSVSGSNRASDLESGVGPKAEGHLPTLIASFLHFDLSFMIWVLLGALGIYIADSAGLTPGQKGLMVAVPILSGSLLRIPLGLLSDRIGGKRTGIALLAFLFIPLTLGWQSGDNLPSVLIVGLLLGTAGASFAVALPLASRWYPKERQGLILGIAAAGNSGSVLSNLVAPRLAEAVGWHNVLALAMVPLAVVLTAFLLMAKDKPGPRSKAGTGQYLAALKQPDLWWLCLLYGVTFGGYVGLSSFLPIFFRDQYGVSAVQAGYLTAIAATVGSAVRPLGGYLGDRFGGVNALSVLLLIIAGFYASASLLPTLGPAVLLIVIGMACLGLGNGAVFQLVPGRFPTEIGVATGVVGALGGLGGFALPILLGNAREATGSFGPGLLVLAGLAIGVVSILRVLAGSREGWRRSWQEPRSPEELDLSPVSDRVPMTPSLRS